MNTSAGAEPTTTIAGRHDRETYLLFAIVLFGFTVRANAPGATLAALLASMALAMALFGKSWPTDDHDDVPRKTTTRLLFAILVFCALGGLGWAPSAIGPTTAWLERAPFALWAVLALVLHMSRGRHRWLSATSVTIVALAASLLLGILHINATEGVSLDVNGLHVEAAHAIANGDNPYTDAVQVRDGAPTADPGDMIVGYPYPPVTALAYSLGEWSLSDPRYTSLFCWLVVLGLIGASAARRKTTTPMYAMILLAALPGWPLVLRAGWTEPLTLMFLAVAFATWSRPNRAGTWLGLGLASKQYLIVTAPAALLHRDSGWKRRLLVAIGLVVITIAPIALLDLDAFWKAAIEFHTNTPPRVDGTNLVGLLAGFGIMWTPNATISLVVGVVVGLFAGRRSNSPSRFLMAVGLTLAAFFMVSSQAFANYWFLITGLCVLALASGADEFEQSHEEGSRLKTRRAISPT